MRRLKIAPRPNWLNKLTSEGVLWTTTENGAYWNEAMPQPVYYELSVREQELLEKAGNEVHEMCMNALTWLLEDATDYERTRWFDVFRIPHAMRNKIIQSWNDDEWAFYGRFDFVMTKEGPKLLEYNADTPTTLIESSISQWNWFVDNNFHNKGYYQFNDIHDSMVRHWQDMRKYNNLNGLLHITGFAQVDDYSTLAYIAETAKEAGQDVKIIDIETIGVEDDLDFQDADGVDIHTCFKLYPWEWMTSDEYGQLLPTTRTRFIEPAWKMMLSNKALLLLLWELYPNNRWLVEADYIEKERQGVWVRKPLLSREGSNIEVIDFSKESRYTLYKTGGEYGDEGFIYQKYIEWDPVDGKYPMLGVWMVGSDAVGLGIREDDCIITQNNSRFIPHVVAEG